MSDSDAAAEAADRILCFLHLCEERRAHRRSVPLSRMDGAFPFSIAQPVSRDWLDVEFPAPASPAVWPVSQAFVWPPKGDAEPECVFARTRSAAAAEARQLGAVRFSPRMAVFEQVEARPDGTAASNAIPAALLNGRWTDARRRPQPLFNAYAAEHLPVDFAVAAMLAARWTVWFGHGDGPRVRFLTDPAGAREAFRLRDLPEGRARRAALRHWVSAHSRTAPGGRAAEDADAAVWVRRHLRGATDFVWNGLRCRIQPPAAEVGRPAAAAA